MIIRVGVPTRPKEQTANQELGVVNLLEYSILPTRCGELYVLCVGRELQHRVVEEVAQHTERELREAERQPERWPWGCRVGVSGSHACPIQVPQDGEDGGERQVERRPGDDEQRDDER